MSMLAERKTKQRWSLNPRGKTWSEDSSKFGQKMLEKMGWSKGKGLGAREDGIVDHLKISYKNDSKGMGYKDRNDQWTELDTQFNELLQSISGKKIEETDVKIASLEQKSQSSRVRVHYKKFTRGKDLSRCSEKDLACIFGKRSLKPPHNEKTEEKVEEIIENSNFTYSSGSMVDYFKKKLPSYGKSNGYIVGSNGVLKKDSESEEETRAGLGCERKRKSLDEVTNGTPKKKKREENEEKGLSNPAFDPLFGSVEVQKHVLNTIEEEVNDSIEDVPKRKENENPEDLDSSKEIKKQKKKKKKCLQAIENPTFDENCEETQNSFVSDNFEVKRKKKKVKKLTPIDNPGFDINNSQNNSDSTDNFEVKRNKNLTSIDNPSFDINDSQNSFSSVNLEVKRKKKKEKTCIDNNSDSTSSDNFEVKRKKNVTPIDNPGFDINDSQTSCSSVNFEVKRKKNVIPIDNPAFDISDSQNNSFSGDNFEVKRKKKKKLLTPIDNPSFDVNSDTQSSFSSENYEVKRKKKKKSNGIDNPNFDCQNDDNPDCQNSFVDPTFDSKKKKSEDPVQIEEEPSFDLILNVTSTPSLPKPEPSNQSSSKRRKNVRFSNVIQERLIPNNEDAENRNELFDINSQVIENGLKSSDLEEISKKIEGFQAEIENDINEAKVVKFIGEVGSPEGENQKLPEGTKLKFKYANFGRSPSYLQKDLTKAKSSYKHLIKGDIILGFNNTNLHEIVGYGVKRVEK